MKLNWKRIAQQAALASLIFGVSGVAFAQGPPNGVPPRGPQGGRAQCQVLPSHADLKAALTQVAVVEPEENNGIPLNPNGSENGGFMHMWGTVVNRDGEVCAVVFTGGDRGDEWPGSRVISAQKANTANAFSLPNLALSTANLYSAVQPGGSLFGLQESNPVDVGVAYGGNSMHYGQPNDFMVGGKIGGVNVFGGGVALYTEGGELIGALGVSGDTSCADHAVAWRTRALLELDNVPGGVSADGDDNIIYDIGENGSAGGFGHPVCLGGEVAP